MNQAGTRLHAMDALRALALLLGVFFHSSRSLMGIKGFMPIMDEQTSSAVMAFIYFFLHLFRMTTFFVVAGFFARFLYHRRGSERSSVTA